MGKAHNFKDRTGETKVMKNGLAATILRYGDAKDIDIQFENGGTLFGYHYSHFARGDVKCPMLIELEGDCAKVTNLNVKPKFSFIVDVIDLPIVEKYFWYSTKGYAQNDIVGCLHRVIANAKPHELVDHINMDTLDNRRENLRICTKAENMRNRNAQANNTSGMEGVTWDKYGKKWMAQLSLNKKHIHLGRYDDILDAAKAYNAAAIIHHGEFARLNEI